MKFARWSFFIVCMFIALGVLVTGCSSLIDAQILTSFGSNIFSSEKIVSSSVLESDDSASETQSINGSSSYASESYTNNNFNSNSSSNQSISGSDNSSQALNDSSSLTSSSYSSKSLTSSSQTVSKPASSSIVSKVSSTASSTVSSSPAVSKPPVVVPTITPKPVPTTGAIKTVVSTKIVLDNLIGQSESSIISQFGQPGAKELSEYGFKWYIYNKDYKRFIMIGISNSKVVGVYSNSSSLIFKNVTVGKARTSVKSALTPSFGSPLTAIQKGNTRYIINSTAQRDIFYTGSSYATMFYDNIAGQTLTAIQIISKETEMLIGYYGTPSAELSRSFEKTSFYLANAIRVRMGKLPFVWDDKMASVARAHSTDMMVNNYFSHTNLSGLNSSARFRAAGISYSTCAENIAKNHTSAINAHESYMNSSGHRANILNNCKNLGVGVSMEKGKVLLTQNFVTYK